MTGHSRWDSERAATPSRGTAAAIATATRRIARVPRCVISGIGVATGRARRGYSWSDVMDFDRHVAGVIAGGTRRLALKAQDAPNEQPEVDEARWRTAAALFVQHFDSLAD